MPDTSLGITYPASTGHNRIWEHIQAVADDTNDILIKRNPLGSTVKLPSDYTLTTIITDLAGCSVTINVPTPNAFALIAFTGSCQLMAAGSTSLSAVINLVIDGVVQAAPQLIMGFGNLSVQPNTRGTTSGSLIAPLSGSGNHTIKLQAAAASASGTIKLNALHTHLSVAVFPY